MLPNKSKFVKKDGSRVQKSSVGHKLCYEIDPSLVILDCTMGPPGSLFNKLV